MATRHFNSQLVSFALSLMVQIGFLSHHVSLVAPTLGDHGASIAVSAAALAAFVGRIALARFADRVDLRWTTCGVLLVAAASLAAMAVTSSPAGLMLTSVCYGLTIGNLTTLSPIIARREFGAASFGAVFGVAASAIAVASAFGPGLFGILRDTFNSYGPSLDHRGPDEPHRCHHHCVGRAKASSFATLNGGRGLAYLRSELHDVHSARVQGHRADVDPRDDP